MIASIFFDDQIVVPQGKDLGGGVARQSLREFSFHADEGWQILEALPGTFTLWHEGMDHPVTVGGYGYSLVRVPDVEPKPDGKKGKR
jgi:hypothetical protein